MTVVDTRELPVPSAVSDAAHLSAPSTPRRTIRGDLREIVRELRESRDLTQQLTLRDIRVRYKQAVFGFAWAIVMPVFIVGAGMLVRAAIAFASGHALNMRQIAAIGVKSVPWAFFLGCINMGLPTLVANKALVTKIYFPREVLPLAAVLAQTFDSAIGGVILLVVLPFLGVTWSATLLWVPVLLVLLWTLSLGLALALSCANLFFRDVKYIVQIYVTFGIFVTPVLLDASMYGKRIGPIVMLNPVSPLLEGLRLAVVEHHDLLRPYAVGDFVIWHPWYLAYAAGIALFGLLGAAVVFHRLEERFAETV